MGLMQRSCRSLNTFSNESLRNVTAKKTNYKKPTWTHETHVQVHETHMKKVHKTHVKIHETEMKVHETHPKLPETQAKMRVND